MMLSTPLATILAVSTIYCICHFPASPTDFRYVCCALFGPIFNWDSPWCSSRKTTGWCIKKPPDQIKSSVFLLMAWTERGWAGHGSYPRVMAGSWSHGEPVCLPLLSLREFCLSLAITVCHATECRGHTISSHASLHPGHDGMPFPHILTT